MCDETGAVIPDCVGGTNTCYQSTSGGDAERVQFQSMGIPNQPSPFNVAIADYTIPSGASGYGGSIQSIGTGSVYWGAGGSAFFSMSSGGNNTDGGVRVSVDTAMCLSGSISPGNGVAWQGGPSTLTITSDVPIWVSPRTLVGTGTGTFVNNGTTSVTINLPAGDNAHFVYAASAPTTYVDLRAQSPLGVQLDSAWSYFLNDTCTYEWWAFCPATGVYTNIHTGATTGAGDNYFMQIPCTEVPATP